MKSKPIYYHPKEFFFSEIKPRGVFPKENIFYHVVHSTFEKWSCCQWNVPHLQLLSFGQPPALQFNFREMEQPTSTHFHEKQNKLKPFSPSHERREIWTTTHIPPYCEWGLFQFDIFSWKQKRRRGNPSFLLLLLFSVEVSLMGAQHLSEESRIHCSTYYNDGRKPSLTGPFQLSESLWSKSIATPYSTGLRAYFTFCSAFLWSFPYLPICGTFWRGSKQILLAT